MKRRCPICFRVVNKSHHGCCSAVCDARRMDFGPRYMLERAEIASLFWSEYGREVTSVREFREFKAAMPEKVKRSLGKF